jgi:hypothetical protein
MFTVRSTLHVTGNIVIHGGIDCGLCHTEPLLLPQLTARNNSVCGVSLDASFKTSLSSDFEEDDPVATIESEHHMHKRSLFVQPVFRQFLALSAALNCRIYGGDAQDAFAHSPAPTAPTYVAIDNA